MKQELSPEHRVALIQYRFERAYKTLEEADYMRVGNYFNAAINRLYYACFYAATGLLIAKGIEAGTHNGVKTMLSYHFVRTGVLSLEHGSTFSNLFGQTAQWRLRRLCLLRCRIGRLSQTTCRSFHQIGRKSGSRINGSLPNKNKHILSALPSSSSCHYAISKRR